MTSSVEALTMLTGGGGARLFLCDLMVEEELVDMTELGRPITEMSRSLIVNNEVLDCDMVELMTPPLTGGLGAECFFFLVGGGGGVADT